MIKPTPTSDPVDRDLDALRVAEQARKRRGLLLMVGALACALLVFGAIVALTGGRQGPDLPVEQAFEEDAAKSNDPVCRAMIAALMEQGDVWRKLEPRLGAEVFAADRAKADAALAELEAVRAAIKAQQAASAGAVLRFEKSREELDAWFKHIDEHLQLLAWLGRAHGATERTEPPFPIRDPKRTPEEIRTATTAAIYDDFESLRVWHTAPTHPCGAKAP
jgi:hypothetical protein